MLISRTPLRISFVGGGTDFKEYYKDSAGEVVSVAINKYIYVTVNKKFDGKIHLRYSDLEEVEKVNDLKHTLVKEALGIVGIGKGIEIVTISDVPMKGSGLGSSSALAVGLLNALYAFKGHLASPETLAEQACRLEIEVLKSPIGKQDQYASAFGGFNHITFKADNSVEVESLYEVANYDRINWLEDNTLLFFIKPRSANVILNKFKNDISKKRKCLDSMKLLVNDFRIWLENGVSEHSVGGIIQAGWEYKKQGSKLASDPIIEALCKIAVKAGAVGVKICGAGGGGFLLVMCEKDKQHFVRRALHSLKELEFKFEDKGSKIVYRD